MSDFAVDAERIAAISIDPWLIVVAVVVLILAWLLSRLTRRAVTRIAYRLGGVSPEMGDMAGRIGGYVVLFLGFGVALSILGAPIQPLLAAAIVIGVVMSLALRGIAENFAAGIVLQTRHPVGIQDEIAALGHVGTILEMNGRSVVIATPDGRRVHLPNSSLMANPLVNHTAQGKRRSEVDVRVNSHDPATTHERLLSCTADSPGVLADPKPDVHITAIDPDQVTATIRFWHEPHTGIQVTSDVVSAIAISNRDAGTEWSVSSRAFDVPPKTKS